jgi:hypothetical protein
MISQRPAKLHKDSLSQAHTLIAMKLIAPQDRAAIKDWVSDQTDPDSGKRADRLPAGCLSRARAGCGRLPRTSSIAFKFPRPKTYDSSRAPDENEGDAPVLAKIDPATISGRLATVAAEADANDPAKLKRRIAELEREKPAPPPVDTVLLEQMNYKKGFEDGARAGADAEAQRLGKKLLDYAGTFAAGGESSSIASPPPRQSVAKAAPAPLKREASVRPAPPAGEFNGPQMRVLRSLAMWKALGKDAPSKPMVAMCAGYSHSSGGFANLLGTLRTMGAIEYPTPGAIMLLTDAAEMDASEGKELFRGKLSGPQRKIVDALVAGGEMSKGELGEATAYSATSGGFANLLGQLRTLGIIDYPSPGRVAMEPWVFDVL